MNSVIIKKVNTDIKLRLFLNMADNLPNDEFEFRTIIRFGLEYLKVIHKPSRIAVYLPSNLNIDLVFCIVEGTTYYKISNFPLDKYHVLYNCLYQAGRYKQDDFLFLFFISFLSNQFFERKRYEQETGADTTAKYKKNEHFSSATTGLYQT